MPVMVHPELPDVRRTVTVLDFKNAWEGSGWVLEEEQPEEAAEPTKRKRKETS